MFTSAVKSIRRLCTRAVPVPKPSTWWQKLEKHTSLKMRRKDRAREDRRGLKCSCDGCPSPPDWRENENAGVEAALSLWVRLSIITVKWHIPTARRHTARRQRCGYRLSQQVSAMFPNSKLQVLFISRVYEPSKRGVYSVREVALKSAKPPNSNMITNKLSNCACCWEKKDLIQVNDHHRKSKTFLSPHSHSWFWQSSIFCRAPQVIQAILPKTSENLLDHFSTRTPRGMVPELLHLNLGMKTPIREPHSRSFWPQHLSVMLMA